MRIIEARNRVGGRVWTRRDGFVQRQHAEAGADFIDEEQAEICRLIRTLGLRLVRVLRRGFTSMHRSEAGRWTSAKHRWEELGDLLEPEIRDYRLNEKRWDGPIPRALSRESVAGWLHRVEASGPLRQTAVALRGFFLADPAELSLLALTDQFAEDDSPGEGKFYRIQGGNDRLASALSEVLKRELHLQLTLRAVSQSAGKVRIAVESRGALREITADYLVCTLPAVTLAAVRFDPVMPEPQREAIGRLRYGHATKTLLQFERPFWRRRKRPSAFGTPEPFGAVWDGNEEQHGRAGILTLLAGGGASSATQQLLARGGIEQLVERLAWLGAGRSSLLAHCVTTWETDPWSQGGYAYFDPGYDPAFRSWLARPFGRVFFAGEHTSFRWQGYMNGAVETGFRAAAEIVRAENEGP